MELDFAVDAVLGVSVALVVVDASSPLVPITSTQSIVSASL